MSGNVYTATIKKLIRCGIPGKEASGMTYLQAAACICKMLKWALPKDAIAAKAICVKFIEKKPKTTSPAKKAFVPYAQYVAARKAFYESREWREIRYKALEACGGQCCLCGRSRKHGVVLHVDHIKPRSKFPKLELCLDNLQVLCEDCNLGKSNKDDTDWR